MTLEAALKYPSSFLDPAVVALVQTYQRELAQFSSDVSAVGTGAQSHGGSSVGNVSVGERGKVIGGSAAAVMMAGTKRKWTE